MIRLSAPCIFSDELLPVYEYINNASDRTGVCVEEAYGALPRIHSAREDDRLPDIDFERLSDYARELKALQVRFNYTLNSTAFTLADITTHVEPFLHKLHNPGIDSITVSSPLLLEYIRRRLTSMPFRITLSTITNADSVAQLRQAFDFGADKVVLGIRSNRNMRLLESVAKLVDQNHSVVLLANEFCGNCLMRTFHYHWESMSAETAMSHDDTFFGAYPYNVCEPLWMSTVAAVLKTYWILPQWLDYYGDYNIRQFKITGRTHLVPEWHARVLSMYASKTLNGNVLQLAPHDDCEENVFLDVDELARVGYFDHFRRHMPHCIESCGIACQFCDNIASQLAARTNQNL